MGEHFHVCIVHNYYIKCLHTYFIKSSLNKVTSVSSTQVYSFLHSALMCANT